MGTNHPPGLSGSSRASPARDANNGSGRRGRSDNGCYQDPDRSFVPQHLCSRTSSKDSVIIEKFRGKRGDDVERFLRAVQRRMNRNLEANKYYTEEEQNTDHVALIHRDCSSRVREYIRSLKGNWEEEPLQTESRRPSNVGTELLERAPSILDETRWLASISD